MAHRRLIIQERITAIVGAALLFSLVGLSYYYSIQITLDDLKYVPSASSPDFTATDVTMSDFNEQGVASQRLAAQSVEHYSDERMMAHQATYHTLDPSKPQIVARADKAESLDGLETVQLTGTSVSPGPPPKRSPISISRRNSSTASSTRTSLRPTVPSSCGAEKTPPPRKTECATITSRTPSS